MRKLRYKWQVFYWTHLRCELCGKYGLGYERIKHTDEDCFK